jgi:hypothetical protein
MTISRGTPKKVGRKNGSNAMLPTMNLKPRIHCAWLPCEAMYVPLPHKVDTMLLHAAELGACRAKSERIFCLAAKGFQCAVLVRLRRVFQCFFSSKMENKNCLALIQLFKSKALLWNSKSANYHNKSICKPWVVFLICLVWIHGKGIASLCRGLQWLRISK